jgi:ribonuclease P protein component
VTFFLSRAERLSATKEFLEVKSRGFSVKTDPFWMQVMKVRSGDSKLGVIATRRLGNAVFRNKSKRLVRELFRKHKSKISFPVHLVVLPRKSILKTPFHQLEKCYIDALSRASFRI